MGAQNTSLRMAGILSVWTTHMTGTLSSISEELISAVSRCCSLKNWRKARGGFAAENLQQKHRIAFKNIGQSAACYSHFLRRDCRCSRA